MSVFSDFNQKVGYLESLSPRFSGTMEYARLYFSGRRRPNYSVRAVREDRTGVFEGITDELGGGILRLFDVGKAVLQGSTNAPDRIHGFGRGEPLIPVVERIDYSDTSRLVAGALAVTLAIGVLQATATIDLSEMVTGAPDRLAADLVRPA